MNIYLEKILKNDIIYPEFLVALSKSLLCPELNQEDKKSITSMITSVENLIKLLSKSNFTDIESSLVKKEFVILIKILKNITTDFQKCIEKLEIQESLLRNKYFINPALYSKIKENLKKEEAFFIKQYEELLGEEL